MKAYDEKSEYDALEGIIPIATMLTGVNQPDHAEQFIALKNKIL